jgi:autophagy-related protein 11
MIAPGEPSDPNQIRALEDAKQALERELQNERGSRETEVAELSMRNEELRLAVERSRAAEKGVSTKLVDLQTEKLRAEGELQALRTRLSDAERDKQQARQDLSDVTSELEDTRKQLQAEQDAAHAVRVELGERLITLRELAAELEAKEEEKKNQLTDVRESLQRQLATSAADVDDARGRLHELELASKELEDRLARERSEAETTLKDVETRLGASEARRQELCEAIGEKEKLLRDHRSEAELDRAVLERELEELRGKLAMATDEVEDGRAYVKQVESELEAAKSDISKRDEELELRKKEADAARHEADGLRRGGNSTATRALRLAKSLHDSQRETIASLSTDTPEGVSVAGTLDDPPDWASLDFAALEALLDTLSAPLTPTLREAVKSKVDTLSTTVKKWQKECKAYRERAQRATAAASEKIAFRKCVRLGLFSLGLTSLLTGRTWGSVTVSQREIWPFSFLRVTRRPRFGQRSTSRFHITSFSRLGRLLSTSRHANVSSRILNSFSRARFSDISFLFN